MAKAGAGWYLLAPPQATRDGQALVGVNTQAPLSQWQAVASFDQARECEETRARWIDLGYKTLERAPKDVASRVARWDEPEQLAWSQALTDITVRCIATDDPRLK